MEQILARIQQQIQLIEKEDLPLLIALDGRCGSGKTTLAALLAKQLSGALIHMDDFFLRPEQRTKERLQQPGENADHERVLKEVLLPFQKGEPISYRSFNCQIQQLTAPVEVPRSHITILEGSYSCHPALRPYYDLKIFLSVDPEEQMHRIRLRNGNERAEQFQNRWIPMEEQYFQSFGIEAACDLSFDMTHTQVSHTILERN